MVSCEAELTELMRQIDFMMQARKSDWDTERKAMLARLDARETECHIHTAMLDQKTVEVCGLICLFVVLGFCIHFLFFSEHS